MATTAFEDRVAASDPDPAWTTIGEENSYLAALTGEYDTVAYDRVGDTVLGRAMHLLRIGHPVAPTMEEAQGKPCVLILAKQHGNEYAGREGALILARRLAEATGALEDFLETHCVVMMPNCNPDGGSRDNANNVNLNRDHVKCTQPETRAMQWVMREYRPIFVMDLHEAAISNDVEYNRPFITEAPAGLVSLSIDCIDDYIIPRCVAEGYSHAAYTSPNAESTGTQIAALRYAASLLIETDIAGSDKMARAQCHLDLSDAALEFVIDNSATLISTSAAAKAQRIADGLAGTTPFDAIGTVLNPPPMGYSLTDQQLADSEIARDLHGIERIRPGIVSMGQQSQPVIPFMLDSRALDPLIGATPLSSGVPTAHELDNLQISASTPSVDCIEATGTVHFLTVAAGGPELDPFDIAQLVEHGAV